MSIMKRLYFKLQQLETLCATVQGAMSHESND